MDEKNPSMELVRRKVFLTNTKTLRKENLEVSQLQVSKKKKALREGKGKQESDHTRL